ncbi:hypothetical protein RQP46_007131 [Phenoliferia psychrophenolica]
MFKLPDFAVLCHGCRAEDCSVACQKRDWKIGHKAICLTNVQDLRQEDVLAAPLAAGVDIAFRQYIHAVITEIDYYVPLMYHADRADSTYHKENVVSLEFLYDPTISHLLRHQFRLVSSRAIPYSEVDYGTLDAAAYTPETLDNHPALSGQTPYQATAWQLFTV